MQQIGFFIVKLNVRSTCFRHHYAHHQERKSYTDYVSGLRDAAASRKPDT